jgi:hypothetical protein
MAAPERQLVLPLFDDFQRIISGASIHDEDFHLHILLKYRSKCFVEKATLVK